MQKRIGQLFVILLFFSMISLNVSSELTTHREINRPLTIPRLLDMLPLDDVDQRQNHLDFHWGVYGDNLKLAQSFIPTLNVITRVELRLTWNGDPEGLEISIRDNLNAEDLTSIYLNKGSIEPDSSGYWYEFDFPDIIISPSTTHYIVWTPHGCPDRQNTFFWGLKDNNPYEDGKAWKYVNDSWEILNPESLPRGDPDFSFQTNGRANNPPERPTQPSGPSTGLIDQELTYQSSFSDVDGDDLEILFDWSDGTTSGWIPIGNNESYSVSHNWYAIGRYDISTKAKDQFEESPWSTTLTVIIGNIAPERPARPSGPTTGKIHEPQTYSTSTIDYNGDSIYYQWDWGDEIDTNWYGPYESEQICEKSHTWTGEGEYDVCVRAKDTEGHTSEWSSPLIVSMPKNIRNIDLLFTRIIAYHPFISQVLQQLLD
jgi:hypothetical protein